MKFFTTTSLLLAFICLPSISLQASASDLDVEYKSLDQMVGSLKLEKKQIEAMVDTMVASGRISSDDGVKAKREIASLKEDDLEDLKMQAVQHIKANNLLSEK